MGTGRTDEFRKDAVRIALTSGLSRRQVSDDLGGGRSAGMVPTAEGLDAFPGLRGFREVLPDEAETFHQAQRSAAATLDDTQRRSVSVYSPEDLRTGGYRMFLSEDGKTSFAVSPSGEVSSVLAAKYAPKGAAEGVLMAAQDIGGDWLQAFDGGVPILYAKRALPACAAHAIQRRVRRSLRGS